MRFSENKGKYMGIAVFVMAILIAVGIFGKVSYDRKKEEAFRRQQKKEVNAYQEKSFSGKKIENIDFSGKTAEQIQKELLSVLKKYRSKKAEIQVDGDTHVYSMKKIGQNFLFQGSDGQKYTQKKVSELAQKVVEMDKDKTIEQQYDILKGKKQGTSYLVEVIVKRHPKKLRNEMNVLAKKYEISVQNSHILKDGTITGTKKGQTLKIKTMQKALLAYCKELPQENFTMKCHTDEVDPTWFAKDLRKVNTVISSFTTSFVSYTGRGHNVQLGASRINGTCLLPGEKVSFDQVVHDNSDGNSFALAGSYLNGKVVQTAGGGICQISTTAYNALLRAGIIPTKRYPHSMPVHYVSLGLDAAISQGVKDLEVTNTLDVPIIIKMFTNGNRLTAQVISYPNALKGYSYLPYSVPLSSLSAKAYLDTYKDGKKISTKFLHTDRYMPEA